MNLVKNVRIADFVFATDYVLRQPIIFEVLYRSVTMPYTNNKDRIYLIEHFNFKKETYRMGKLTAEQIEEIKERYFNDTASIRSIAEDYGVSRSTINRVLNPQYAEAEREKCRERWHKNHTSYARRHYSFTLNPTKDADIIEKLDSVKSKQGFIKKVIRDAINK